MKIMRWSRLRESASSLLLIATLASYGLAFVTGAIQARLLGPEGRGELAAAVVPGTLIAMLATLNVQDYFGNRAAEGEDRRRLVSEALGTSLVLGMVLVPVYLAMISVIFDPGSRIWAVLVGFALVLPVAIFTTSGVWVASGSARWAAVAWSRVLPGLLLAVGLLAMAPFHTGVVGVGAVIVASTVGGPLLALALFRQVPLEWPRFSMLRRALRFGMRAWPAAAIWLLAQRIDSLVVTAIATREEVGYYVVAVSVASILMAVSNAVGVPARNYAAQGNFRAVRRRLLGALVGTAGAGAVLAVMVPFVVPVVFGAAFAPVNKIAWVLIGAQVPFAAATVLSLTLVGAGFPSRPLVGVSLGLAATVAGMFCLYPPFGAVGVAFASLLGASVTAGFLLVAAHRAFGVLGPERPKAPDGQEIERV